MSNISQMIIAREALILLQEGLSKRPIKYFKLGHFNFQDTEVHHLSITFEVEMRDLEHDVTKFSNDFIKPAVKALLKKIKVPKGKTTMISEPLLAPLGGIANAVVSHKGLGCRVITERNLPTLNLRCSLDMVFKFA